MATLPLQMPDNETRTTARRRLAAAFAAAGLDSADLDARLLVCVAAGLDHAGLIRDPDVPLAPHEAEALADYAARRLAREPVSRILGRREFWGLDLMVSPAVLDPRPETEGLVASALDAIGGRRDAPLSVLDLGVGSGAILAALLTELPSASALGIDRSEAACRMARANLDRLGVGSRAGIVCADWTCALKGRFDLIVSNPPYIASSDLAGLDPEVRLHDRSAALDGGVDGLDAYRAIAPRLRPLLAEGGTVCFECGTGQGADVVVVLGDAGLGASVYRDLAGHDRVVVAALAT